MKRERTLNLEEILTKILQKEGFRSNHSDDLGGDTTYGITEKTARKLGYSGLMADLSKQQARDLYRREYIERVRFDEIHKISATIGHELIDTGVNMGQVIAAKFLQRWLNAYNKKQAYYADLLVDGLIGSATLNALKAFLKHRGNEGEQVLCKSLNCSQGARYLDITEARERNETFVYGWMKHRVE